MRFPEVEAKKEISLWLRKGLRQRDILTLSTANVALLAREGPPEMPVARVRTSLCAEVALL